MKMEACSNEVVEIMFSVLSQISRRYDNMTQVEKRIADFMLGNPTKVINMPVKEIANSSNTSDAAIVRFSKRLGLKGIKELKVELAKELHTLESEEVSREINLELDSHEAIFDKVFRNSIQTLHNTERIVSKENLKLAAEQIVQTENPLIFGIGESAHVGSELEHKLHRANINAYFTTDRQLCLTKLSHLGEGDVLIVVTLSGKSKAVVEVIKMAKQQDVTVIILAHHHSTMAKRYADVAIEITEQESDIRFMNITSRISQIVVCDILFLYVCKLRGIDALTHIEKTRQFFVE